MLGFSSLLLEPAGVDAKPRSSADPTAARRSELGQFMTPTTVADHMVASLDTTKFKHVRLLDAGAGRGALSIAFARHWAAQASSGSTLAVDAYEIDPAMARDLRGGFVRIEQLKGVSTRVTEGDFFADAVARIARGERPYTHAILNPPYKKISSDSAARAMLSKAGIETVNLYSGFVALSLLLMQDHGELVAIIPRSFCNGPYYKAFRETLFANAALISIHLFKARDKAFAADNVLQENVIIRLKRGGVQGNVTLSTSTDASFSDLRTLTVPFEQVVGNVDPAKVIHIPLDASGGVLAGMAAYRSSLTDVGLQVSTGPVVDFRLKPYLRDDPIPGDVPLLYPVHFGGSRFAWPKSGGRKPNAIVLNSITAKLVYPLGYYVVVRRFSSKEETRRIVASVVDPTELPEPWVAFENHLNVFHQARGPLPETVARGLAVFLNAKVVDDWLRNFSGHTQVNATDLRALPLPNRNHLQKLGEWSRSVTKPTQDQIDAIVANPQ